MKKLEKKDKEITLHIFSLMCVGCGNLATMGSMKHPYCKKCFKKVWNNDYKKYFDWLEHTHG